MSSSRSSVTALVIAVAVAVVAAASAHAVTIAGGGVSGYVTSADTGLPLGGAVVGWSGVQPATTDGSGRYLFLGLAPTTSGSLTVAGPAGYEKTQVDGVTVPAT